MRGYWDGREPMEDESDPALELAQLKRWDVDLRKEFSRFESRLAQTTAAQEKKSTPLDEADELEKSKEKSKGWSDKLGDLYNTCIYECVKSVNAPFLLEPYHESQLSREEWEQVKMFTMCAEGCRKEYNPPSLDDLTRLA